MIYYIVSSVPWDYKDWEPVGKEAIVQELYDGNYELAAKDGYGKAFAEMSKIMEFCRLRWIGFALDYPLWVGPLEGCEKAYSLCPSWAKVEVFHPDAFWKTFREEDIILRPGADFPEQKL